MLRKSTLVIFTFIAIIFSSCAIKTQLNSHGFDVSKISGFNNETVLLINQHTSGMYKNLYNKRKTNDLKEHYKGKYEMISFDNIDNDPKYSDKKVYRFMLKEEHIKSTTIHADASRTVANSVTYYILYDRIEKTNYDLNIYGKNPDRVFRKAVIKVNSLLPTT